MTSERTPLSMANYKTLYNNALMLDLFIIRFSINPNSTKNKKIVNELLEPGRIAAYKFNGAMLNTTLYYFFT
jgi:hypothetical protein